MPTWPAKTNYATGDVLTAAQMQDIGNALNSVESAQYAAGKNKVINGAFDIWQRGTTFTNPAGDSYTADRFMIDYGTAAPTSNSVTRQAFTPGTAPVAGYESAYFFRSSITTVGTTTRLSISHKIEDVRTYANQIVTLSFWAKADTARTLGGFIQQNFGSGGSATVSTAITSQSITTSWARYSMQVTIPSIAGKTIGTSSFLNIRLDQAVAAGSVLDLWGLQLEPGNSVTSFQTATGTLQGELALAQRYYFRLNGEAVGQRWGYGSNISTTQGSFLIPFPVQMRVRPTALEQTGTASDYSIAEPGTFTGTCDAVPTYLGALVTSGTVTFTVGTGGLTNTRVSAARANSTTAYLAWSAEL